MKVLASTLTGLALGQGMRDQGEDRWTGFDYDYGFGTAERNQISQSNTINTLYAQGAGMASTGLTITAAGDLGHLFDPYQASAPAMSDGSGSMVGTIAFPTYLGNGMMCWYCDSESVHDCFNAGQFQVCYGQDYFCYFHERRKIGHYFNRREKYIDHHESVNTDLFLVRLNNEAWNLDGLHKENDTRGGETPPESHMTDDTRPKTDIHVMAGCQQPQACLRQQMQNQAINIGVAFYGDEAREIGNLHTGTTTGDFQTYIHPTSRRNVREGLCRLGKDWTYYSGKLWHYDTGGKYYAQDPLSLAGGSACNTSANSNALEANGACYYRIDTIDKVNQTPISEQAENGSVSTGSSPMDDNVWSASGAEANAVFGRQADNKASPLLWGRGIYDAHDIHGHQFWHERESWYNGMRPNGFPDQHYHGGKGTESVCHFCCNPASSDGMFCNRRLLDNTRGDSKVGTPALAAANSNLGVTFSDGSGHWYKSDAYQVSELGVGAAGNYNKWNDDISLSDDRNDYIDEDLVRADDPNLNILHTPMANSYNTDAAWLAEHRFHGMFRNPETQVSQEYLDPYFATSGR